ncbi:MAG: zf-HC2 domain-containing protein [Salinivirgaceae bacterium]|nr:zf-HC2 domain-containing protein [Salinivirgaceae bacterium]
MIPDVKNINTCPSVFTYEKYLKNELATSEKLDFEKHLKSCELCQQAIEGYKAEKLFDISRHFQDQPKFVSKQTKVISHSAFFRYAATVLILIGFGVATKYIIEGRNAINSLNQYVSVNEYSQFKTMESKGAKKLTRKTTDQYLYLGNDNKTLFNDQIIKIEELNEAKSLKINTNRIIIQVENNDPQNSQQIVNKIKEQHNIPVFTIRNIR